MTTVTVTDGQADVIAIVARGGIHRAFDAANTPLDHAGERVPGIDGRALAGLIRRGLIEDGPELMRTRACPEVDPVAAARTWRPGALPVGAVVVYQGSHARYCGLLYRVEARWMFRGATRYDLRAYGGRQYLSWVRAVSVRDSALVGW